MSHGIIKLGGITLRDIAVPWTYDGMTTGAVVLKNQGPGIQTAEIV